MGDLSYGTFCAPKLSINIISQLDVPQSIYRSVIRRRETILQTFDSLAQ